MATKITNNLYWKELSTRFSVMPITIGDATVVPFELALEDGSIEALIHECADAMHGGDIAPVVKQLIENCQSKRCVDKSRGVSNSTAKAASAANEKFFEYLKVLKGTLPSKPSTRGVSGKAKHAITAEEIEAFTDALELGKVIDSMASYKAKNLSAKFELTEDDNEFLARYDLARRKLKELKAGAKKAPEVSEALLAKLTKDGKATLSAAEVAELRKLLAQ